METVDLHKLLHSALCTSEGQAGYIEAAEEMGYGFDLRGHSMTPEERKACNYKKMWALQATKEVGQGVSIEDLTKQGLEADIPEKPLNQKFVPDASHQSSLKTSSGKKLVTESADKNLSTQLNELAAGEQLRLRCYDVPDYPYLIIERNPKYPNLFILANENEAGEQVNVVKFSSKENTLYWASRCEPLVEEYKMSKNKTSNLNESVELEYRDLPIEILISRGTPGGYYSPSLGNWLPDEGETEEVEVDYTYHADKQEVEELLADYCAEDGWIDEHEGYTDEELYQYVSDNLDELVTKYKEELLKAFEEKAIEAAEEEHWDDYLYESAESNPYIFKDLKEAIEDEAELSGFWDDVEEIEEIEEVEEDFEPIDTKSVWEDLEYPDLEPLTPYDWSEPDLDATPVDWVFVAEKDIFDPQGFVTTYTWYKSGDDKTHLFMIGDETPDEHYADHVCRSEGEAQDWFNSYANETSDETFMEDVELPEEAVEEELVADDSLEDSKPSASGHLTEGRMKDLSIDVENAGGKEKLALKLEKELAALDSELSFLTDIAPREIGRGGAFDSMDEIEAAKAGVKEERALALAKIKILRGAR